MPSSTALPGLGGGIPVLVGDADVPVHLVLAEDVVEHVEDGLVPARCRVDDHVHAAVRRVGHGCPPEQVLRPRYRASRSTCTDHIRASSSAFFASNSSGVMAPRSRRSARLAIAAAASAEVIAGAAGGRRGAPERARPDGAAGRRGAAAPALVGDLLVHDRVPEVERLRDAQEPVLAGAAGLRQQRDVAVAQLAAEERRPSTSRRSAPDSSVVELRCETRPSSRRTRMFVTANSAVRQATTL